MLTSILELLAKTQKSLKKAEAASKPKSKPALIPKPPGQAGRKVGGYTLQDAMGYKNRTDEYNYIRVSLDCITSYLLICATAEAPQGLRGSQCGLQPYVQADRA
jgi:hypothetical protein